MNQAVPRAAPPAKPRRRWRQLFLQFNLRSLLGLITLSAVACWWYLRPEIAREELADKYLTRQRQTRLVDPSTWTRSASLSPAIFSRQTYVGPPSMFSGAEKLVPVNDGSWQLRDKQNHLLASGSCAAAETHGRWTIYHASGRKAAQGQMSHGHRVNTWRTWDEYGHRESEVNYAIVSRELPPIASPQLANACCCGSVLPTWLNYTRKKMVVEDSSRHGLSRTWHPNGKLKSQGAYENDLRDGPWSFYNDRGQRTAGGEYHRGLREGPWDIADSITGKMRVVQFICDRPQEDFDRLLADIKAQLSSGEFDQQITALDRLESLGRAAVKPLVNLLDDADTSTNLKFLALRRLAHLAEIADVTGNPIIDLKSDIHIARLRQFTQSTDDRLAGLAMLLRYRNSPDDRENLYAPLIASARASPDIEWKQCVLAVLCHYDKPRRQATFIELAHAADTWRSPPYDLSSDSLSSPFHQIALACDNHEDLIKSASHSPDVRLRRFAVLLVRLIVFRRGPQPAVSPAGKQGSHYPVPDAYRNLIERATLDPDQSVREAAEMISQPLLNPHPHQTVIPVVG
jgi:hypothetical protein